MTAAAPIVATARRVAGEVLAPAATATDQAEAVPASNLDALATAGLYGLFGPSDLGGAAAPPAETRLVYEALAGACGATFFLWVQHHALVGTLLRSDNSELRAGLLPELCAGRLRAGVAFAHLRRPGPPAVTAEPEGDGWRLSGEAPWMSGWGLIDVVLVAAVNPAAEVVWAVIPAEASSTVCPSEPLRLSVLQATRTVRLRLEGAAVAARDVVLVEPLAGWLARDRLITAQANPAAFGLAETALGLLAGRDPVEPRARLASDLAECRSRAYALADQVVPAEARAEHIAALQECRALGLDLAGRCALALVAASGGAAMGLGHPAQRLAREAAFYLVQAQTGAGRAASLDRLSRR